ncbi:MAG: CvpA family protein [Deltaproteobacteria bacterium]|nr:CvpA family protein [Deltaproteobacteria bacterium]
MNILDIIIIAAVIFFLIRGIFRGIVREIGSLAGVVLGIWLANAYHPTLALLLKSFIPPGKYLPLIAFALIFLVVLVLCNLLGSLLKKLFQRIFLGWMDRILGACLALLKGIILSYLIIVLVTFLVPRDSLLVKQSRLAPVIVSAYQTMVELIPKGSHEKLKKSFEEQKSNLQEVLKGKI